MPASVTCKFEMVTGTAQFVVACPETKKCAIIDPVLNYDPASGKSSTTSADELIQFVKDGGLECEWILETHAHADHLTASHYLREQLPGSKTAIGARFSIVQDTFRKLYNLPQSYIEGNFFDKFWEEGDKFSIGNLGVEVLFTPGHTPADLSYYIKDDAVFTGDSIFMPDMGTARCDFPGGNTETLWNTLQKLLSLPEGTRCFVGHDYGPGGREYAAETTIGEQKKSNKHAKDGITKEEFIEMRTTRDAQLNAPRLLHPSLNWNIRGGHPPPPEDNGMSYVKIPDRKSVV